MTHTTAITFNLPFFCPNRYRVQSKNDSTIVQMKKKLC